jgi:hypothetical protein
MLILSILLVIMILITKSISVVFACEVEIPDKVGGCDHGGWAEIYFPLTPGRRKM